MRRLRLSRLGRTTYIRIPMAIQIIDNDQSQIPLSTWRRSGKYRPDLSPSRMLIAQIRRFALFFNGFEDEMVDGAGPNPTFFAKRGNRQVRIFPKKRRNRRFLLFRFARI